MDYLYYTYYALNAMMFLRMIPLVGNEEKHSAAPCFTVPFLLVFYVIGVYEVTNAGHDYLLFFLIFSLELFQSKFTVVKRVLLAFILVALSRYIISLDTARELYCGYTVLVPSSSYNPGPMSKFMTLCLSERNRHAITWVIFFSYLVCTASEWQSLGLLCDNGNIQTRLLINFLKDFEKESAATTLNDRANGDEKREELNDEDSGAYHNNFDAAISSLQSSHPSESPPKLQQNIASINPPSPETRFERKLAPNKDLSSFECHSVTGYNPEEERNLRELLSLYHNSGLDKVKQEDMILSPDKTHREMYNISIGKDFKPNKKSGKMAGKAVGIVGTSMSQVCAWCWNFCSDERMKSNAKLDVQREIVSLDSDHGMTIFAQKFFPPPHANRDFLLRQVWKRADDHTVFVYMYDDKSSIFNETFYRMPLDSRKTARASLKSILVLQQEIGDGSADINPIPRTRVSQLCLMDLNGKLDDSLTLGALKSCMNIITDLQMQFPPVKPGIGDKSEELGSPTFDATLGDASMTSGDPTDLRSHHVDVAGFQCLLDEAKRVEDLARRQEEPSEDSSSTSGMEGSTSPHGSSESSMNDTLTPATNRDHVDISERGNKDDNDTATTPRSTLKDDECGGGFVFWLIKNNKEAVVNGDIDANSTTINSTLKKRLEVDEVRDFRLLYRNTEFKDLDVEKDYIEYFNISHTKNIIINISCLAITSFVALVMNLSSLRRGRDINDEWTLAQDVLLLSLTCLIIVVSLSLLRFSGKDGKLYMISLHLLSGLVFILKLHTVTLTSKVFVDTHQAHQTHIFQVCIYIYLSSLIFLNLISLVDARNAKPHLLVHSLLIVWRLFSITKHSNYIWFLHCIYLPAVLLGVCFFYIQVQDSHLRNAFKKLYVNFYEEFSYRVGRFNAAYNQQQMEDIQIASNQFREGYKGIDISFDELEFQKQIGQGTTCTVHMALYRNKIVAVRQLIMSQINRYSAASFVAEMCLLSKLSHPNIICLYGVVQFNSTRQSQLSMVLEYASEGSVLDYLRAHESMDWQGYKRDISIGIATGMLYLHTRSFPILHRDLKTSNCLVTEWREVKICDFGACWCKHSSDTPEASEVIGSKYHMAPEMLSGERYDEKVDVFAFGSVLADIGMGGNLQKLFLNRPNGPKAFDFNEFIVQGWHPPLPNAWTVEMPVIAELIEKCWNKDPKERPSFRKIKSTLRQWSGKLTRKLNKSAVLRGATEYTEEENAMLAEEMVNFKRLNIPPDNIKLGKHNNEFFLQRN